MAAAFISMLDNDDVIVQLASALSASINLILNKKLSPLVTRLDNITIEIKVVNTRINAIEQENTKLKQIHDGLQDTIAGLTTKVNLLEQKPRKCSLIVTDVQEIYAERIADAFTGTDLPESTREDTIKTTIAVFNEACNITVTPADLQSAVRLRSKHGGPRPLLVTFHSLALRNSIMKSRRSKQTLRFQNSSIYINDHLTKFNSDLSFKARQLVK